MLEVVSLDNPPEDLLFIPELWMFDLPTFFRPSGFTNPGKMTLQLTRC
jgi:hypothetical protein